MRHAAHAAHAYDRLLYRGAPKAVLAMDLKHSVHTTGIARDALETAYDTAVAFASAALARTRRGEGWTRDLPSTLEKFDARCPGRRDDALAVFLRTRNVAFTPEMANLTAIVRSGAEHLVAVGACLLDLSTRVLHFWHCVGPTFGLRLVAPDGAIASMKQDLTVLRRTLEHDVRSARPDPTTLTKSLVRVADATLVATSLAVDAATTLPDSAARSNATDVDAAWVDTLCCASLMPSRLVSLPPGHRVCPHDDATSAAH